MYMYQLDFKLEGNRQHLPSIHVYWENGEVNVFERRREWKRNGNFGIQMQRNSMESKRNNWNERDNECGEQRMFKCIGAQKIRPTLGVSIFILMLWNRNGIIPNNLIDWLPHLFGYGRYYDCYLFSVVRWTEHWTLKLHILLCISNQVIWKMRISKITIQSSSRWLNAVWISLRNAKDILLDVQHCSYWTLHRGTCSESLATYKWALAYFPTHLIE